MDQIERQRRHDEKWQRATLDGLSRILEVLHDISDGVQELANSPKNSSPDRAIHPPDDRPLLLSVKGTAEAVGIPSSSLRNLIAARKGPVPTKIGGRLYFHRDDIDQWLQEQRDTPSTQIRPWRQAFLPGRIGSDVPASSAPPVRSYCSGSHSEPLAASRYSGRAVCRVCRDDVIVNRDGRLRKHLPRTW